MSTGFPTSRLSYQLSQALKPGSRTSASRLNAIHSSNETTRHYELVVTERIPPSISGTFTMRSVSGVLAGNDHSSPSLYLVPMLTTGTWYAIGGPNPFSFDDILRSTEHLVFKRGLCHYAPGGGVTRMNDDADLDSIPFYAPGSANSLLFWACPPE